MQQAIPRHRHAALNPFREIKHSLSLLGSLATELMALASLMAALSAGLAGLLWLLG